MCAHRCRLGAAVVAAGLLCGLTTSSRGDEPVKPTTSASAVNPAVPAPGHSVHGEAFNDGPRHAAYLMPGMGKIHFPVTAKGEAQPFIDQGVAQLHSFYYFEAERSFRQAAKLDPTCAMAFWGMAMANVNNEKRAKGFLKEARKRAARINRHETLFLEALETFYKEGASLRDRRRNYLLGLETIIQEFPADIDARAWLAMVTWQGFGEGIGSRQAVDTVIDTVLQAEPLHPGGHHYRIHLWDGVKPIRAEKSAGLYAKTALGIAHAWHMPGHTYTGLKRYADAAYQQEGSARVDHAYMIRDRVMPFEIHNYAHNNQWLCTSYSHIGRARDAIAVARNLVDQPRDPQKNGPNDGGSPSAMDGSAGPKCSPVTSSGTTCSTRPTPARLTGRAFRWNRSSGLLRSVGLTPPRTTRASWASRSTRSRSFPLSTRRPPWPNWKGCGLSHAVRSVRLSSNLPRQRRCAPRRWLAPTWPLEITVSPKPPLARPSLKTPTRSSRWRP